MNSSDSDNDTDLALAEIGEALKRLDARRVGRPGQARLDLAFMDGRWIAQVLADALRESVVGASAVGPELAVLLCRDEVRKIDWRRVKR